MQWYELDVLDELGFSIYEKKALAALAVLGVADAATLCRDGEIPTSKIYQSMEKLAALGVAEIQPTRPKLYAALPADVVVDRLVAAAQSRADRFAEQSDRLRELLSSVRGRVAGRETFADLALGVESHVKRHLVRLAGARERILSYLEDGDLVAIDQMTNAGFPLLRRVARNTAENRVEHRIIFGFRRATAPQLSSFLRAHAPELADATGLRYSGELGHPFHVIDGELVILSLDHPFIPEGRFASLLVRDRELAQKLMSGFDGLWAAAMRDLGEVRFDPRREGD
jgi:hypothetical protein